MIPPLKPSNEIERLFMLKRLHFADSSLQPFMQSIVSLSTQLFKVPIAFISAVESDRQCFVSREGLEVTESKRDISICGHVVASDQGLLIPDTRLDPRFADNPFVTAKQNPIIFYAGQPIRLNHEFIIGTLCVVDHQPRELSDAEFAKLGELADMVSSHFELKLQSYQLDKVETLLNNAHQMLLHFDVREHQLLTPLNDYAQQLINHLPPITELADLGRYFLPEQSRVFENQLEQLYSAATDIAHLIVQITLPDQPAVWFDMTLTTERDDLGDLLRVFVHLQNITAQKTQQQGLEQAIARYDSIVEASETGYWEWDMGDHLFWSAECMRMLGFPALTKQLVLDEFKAMIHPDDLPVMFAKVEEAIAARRGFEVVYRIKNHLNGYTWIQGRGRVTQYHADGTPLKMLGTHTNIDQLIKLQQELELKTQQANLGSQAKAQLVANVSHELRTPLNAIIGMSHLLQTTGLNQQQLDYANKIDQASKSLLLIVNELLDFSKLDAGRIVLEQHPYCLMDPFDYVRNIFDYQFQNNKITFQTNIDQLANLWVLGDGLRLQQVLTNLVGNAIKFTEFGQVALMTEITDEDRHYCLTVRVIDSGIGMSPEQVAGLFTPFYQADSSITRRYGGTGLGLTISQAFIKQMGGEIAVNSEPGVGTEFHFTLKLEKTTPSIKSLESLTQLKFDFSHNLVWVVEDNPINQQIMGELFQMQGIKHKLFGSGEQLLDYVHKHALQPPSLILLDQNLTGITGMDTLHKLRQFSDYEQVPIILLSADDMSKQIEYFETSRCRAMLKPFQSQALFTLMAELMKAPLQSENSVPDASSTLNHASPENTALPNLYGFDLEEALVYLGGSKSLLHRLLADYYKNYHQVADRVTDLVDQQQWSKLKQLIHSFKGISDSLGAHLMSEHLKKMDRVLMSKLPDAQMTAALSESFSDCHSACEMSFASLQRFLSDPKTLSYSPSSPTMDLSEIKRKLQLLKHNLQTFDGNSLSLWQELATNLHHHVTDEVFYRIEESINQFEFEQALDLLNQLDLPNDVHV